jgi:hypothetical protein
MTNQMLEANRFRAWPRSQIRTPHAPVDMSYDDIKDLIVR